MQHGLTSGPDCSFFSEFDFAISVSAAAAADVFLFNCLFIPLK
jgi:hypothetical protein